MKKFLFVSKFVADSFADDVLGRVEYVSPEYLGYGCWAVSAPEAFLGHARYFYDWAFIGFMD